VSRIKVINNRLYLELREKRGLLYSCSFEMDLPYFLESGFFQLSLAPLSDKVDEAIAVAIEQLQSIRAKNITQAELDEAQRPLVESKRSAQHDNGFWSRFLRLVARQKAGFAMLHDLPEYYQALQLGHLFDVIDRHLNLDRMWIGIGTSAPDSSTSASASLPPSPSASSSNSNSNV
jgi:predicted Zn-dependent peptidase